MRKSGKQKPNSNKKKAAPHNGAANASQVKDATKRNTLAFLGKGLLGFSVIGGGGFYFYNAYQKDLKERDLTRIGFGKPTIVQIHDPNCQLCATLQKETRAALSNFDDETVKYLVANIRTKKGLEFAQKYNVPHVSLLLFNKRGQLQNVLQGVRREEELTNVISTMIDK
jgi:hypothetical protein